MSKPLFRQRLLDLAVLLDDMPPAMLDLKDFINPCGTVVCAVGYAALQPSFQEQGLIFRDLYDDSPTLTVENMSGEQPWLAFNQHRGTAAAQEFFGLNAQTFLHLFALPSYDKPPTPAVVAERIRETLAS